MEILENKLYQPDFTNRFDDKRLDKKGLQIIKLLTLTASSSIRKISQNQAVQKSCYRFLNNAKVTKNILIDELCERSASICSQRHVLCIQDTTEMNYFSHRLRIKDNSGLGRLDSAKPSLGFKMHSTLMIDAHKHYILGFSDINLWHRPLEMPTRKDRNYKALPIECKESYKWIKAVSKSKERLKYASKITFIEDREGDIYEQLSSISDKNVYYIIRSKANRKTTDNLNAWDVLAQKFAVGSYTIELPTDYRKTRKKESIILKVRYSQITIPKGHHIINKAAYPDSITLNIVEAFEEKKNGISWKLLTTHEVKSFEDAYQIIEWYSWRWMIEQIHRLLKNKGFQIEDSQLESGWAIRKLCIMTLSALLRIVQMNIAYNEPEDSQPIDEVYSTSEIECLKKINKKLQGKTKKQQNKYNDKNLKWETWVIARLGGWKGYDSQGPPGIIVLKRGLDKFTAIYYGWVLEKLVGTQ